MTGELAGGPGNQPYVLVRETHTAVVFLLGDRAYKLKKPVDLGFLDFSTRAARLAACQREVSLNRRLAPDVYLGVAAVTEPGTGGVADHLVVMRRMPDERRLSTLLQAGLPVADELRRVARLVAGFHASCRRGPKISAEGTRDALRERWVASFDQVRPFHGPVLDPGLAGAVERLTLRFLAGREPLFAARIRAGFVLDGHGDLLTDDIFCLPDGPRILDCLEFDDRLRFLDQLDDAAFLAMDLERLGAPELAEAFLGWYVEFAADPAPPSLLHHYLAYRAFVRAKVACLRHQQAAGGAARGGVGGEVRDGVAWDGDGAGGTGHGWAGPGGVVPGGAVPDAVAQARTLTAIAHRHLAAAAVSLVLVGGLPGTGKSTLAGGLADRLGSTLLASDRLRKELAGLNPERSAAAPYREGIYRPAWTRRTYAELLARAERLLGLGESVVLDASWADGAQRAAAAEVAARTHSDLVALHCQAPPGLAAARVAHRRGPSDADPAIAAAMRADADPWPAAIPVDTSGEREAALRQALAAVRPAAGVRAAAEPVPTG